MPGPERLPHGGAVRAVRNEPPTFVALRPGQGRRTANAGTARPDLRIRIMLLATGHGADHRTAGIIITGEAAGLPADLPGRRGPSRTQVSPCALTSLLELAAVDPRYAAAWIFYRRLRRVVFTLFFVALIELRWLTIIPGLAFAATFVIYFLCALWLANWTCPRCRQAFFRGAFLKSLFGGKCFYCDLPKWSVTAPGNTVLLPRFPTGWKPLAEVDSR